MLHGLFRFALDLGDLILLGFELPVGFNARIECVQSLDVKLIALSDLAKHFRCFFPRHSSRWRLRLLRFCFLFLSHLSLPLTPTVPRLSLSLFRKACAI